MLHEKVIEKPLQDMELFELDLAIALIYSDSFFQKKIESEIKCIVTLLKDLDISYLSI